MTARDDAAALVAQLRVGGVLFAVDMLTLATIYADPAGAVTPELAARWRALSLDVRAVLLSEVAEVATMVDRAGLPAAGVVRLHGPGQRQPGASVHRIPPRPDTAAERLEAARARMVAGIRQRAASKGPPSPIWRCGCGKSSVGASCWNCGARRPADAVLWYPPAGDDLVSDDNATNDAGHLAGAA